MRAQARRRQAGVLLPERADPYAEEMKRIAEEQKARAAAEKEAREADKARQAAEKAALAEEMKRIAEEQKARAAAEKEAAKAAEEQAREAAKARQAAEKAAKLEAAKVDKANEALRKERKQEITGVQRGMADAREAINLRTSELELQHSEATAQAKRRADFIKKTQDQIENGLDLAPDRVARMEQAMAAAQKELDEWQAKADALDGEVRSQKAAALAFRKAQQPVASAMQAAEDAIPSLTVADAPMGISSPPKPGGVTAKPDAASVPAVREGVLSHQQAAIASDPTLPAAKRKAALEDIAARRDPVAYAETKRKRMREADVPTLKAALDEEGPALQARLQDYQQRMAALEKESSVVPEVAMLLQRNQQRLQQPHKGADLVTVDGPDGQPMSVFADLADEYQDSLAQWQDKREKLQAEAEEIKLDQQLYNEGIVALNEKQTAQMKLDRTAHYDALNSLPGSKGLGDKLRQIDEIVARHAGGDDAGLQEWAKAETAKVQAEAEATQKRTTDAVQRVYGELAKTLQQAEVDRLPGTDAYQSVENEAYAKAIDALAGELGDKGPVKGGTMGQTQQSPERQQAVKLLRDARATDWSHGDTEAPVRYLSNGQPIVNPSLWMDREGYAKAVEASDATPEQKQAVLKDYPRLEAEAAKTQRATLERLGVFQDWLAKQPADISDVEAVNRFREENQGVFNTGAWKVRLHQALLGVAQGVLGVGQSVAGVAAAVSRQDAPMQAFEVLSKTNAAIAASAEALPTGQWVNFGTSTLVSTIPALAGGTLNNATALAGLQTFGQMYGNAVEGYEKQGLSREEALTKAWIPAAASGLTTALLTKAGGEKGVEALLRSGRFTKDLGAWMKAVGGGALQEGFLEEAPDQLVQGLLERHTFNPDKSWQQILTETLEAGIGGALMGGMFEAMNTRFAPEGGRTESVPPTAPRAEAGNINAPVADISPANASVVDDSGINMVLGHDTQAKTTWRRIAEKAASMTRGLKVVLGMGGASVSNGNLEISPKLAEILERHGGEDVALPVVVSEEVAHHVADVSLGETKTAFYKGMWHRVSAKSRQIVERLYHWGDAARSFEKTARQESLRFEASSAKKSSVAPEERAKEHFGAELVRMLVQWRNGWTVTEQLNKKGHTAHTAEDVNAALQEVWGQLSESDRATIEQIATNAKSSFVPPANSPAPRESELSKPDMGSEGAGPNQSSSKNVVLGATQDKNTLGSSLTADTEQRDAGVSPASDSNLDRFMAARGAVAAWDGGSMPEAKKAVTKAKAEAIIKIAEGKQDELGQDELALVGLHRENDGSFSQGYYDAKGKWQKGLRHDQIPGVEVLHGELVITDNQIEKLRKAGLDAVADAVALPAGERRKQIRERVEQSAKGGESKPVPAPVSEAPKVDTPALSPANKPISAPEDTISMEWASQEPAKAGTTNAVSPEIKQRTAEVATVLEKSGVPRDVVLEVAGKAVAASGVDPDGYASQIASPEFRKAMKDLGWQPAPHNPAKWEPAALNKARTGAEMQQQKASMKPAEVVKKPEVPQALHEQMPDSKRVADLSKTRAPMIERLQKQGVVIRVVKDRKEAAAVLGTAVESNRRAVTQNVNGVPHVVLINPESNEDLLDSFDHEAIHAADLLFEASNPELAAKADAVMDRESPEFDQELYHFLSQEYNGWSKLTVRQKAKEARRAIVEGRWKGRTSTRTVGFRKYLAEFLEYLQKLITGRKSAALADAIANIEHTLGIEQQTTQAALDESHMQVGIRKVLAMIDPAQTPLAKSKEWIVQVKLIWDSLNKDSKNAILALQSVLDGDTKHGPGLGRLFSRIVLVENEERASGMSALNGMLFIDVAKVAAHQSTTAEGALVAMSEEIAHVISTTVIPRAEAIARFRQMAKFAPEIVRDWWQSYYAIPISNNEMPANPPAKLTDEDAFTAFHEILARMFQKHTFAKQVFDQLLPGADAVMTETVEPARNLVDWLVDVIRTMGQRLKASFDRLPKKEKQIWGRYLQKMRTVYAQAVRLQQRLDVALLEVQAEEMAEKQDRKQKRAAKPKNDPELDAELEAAWEAEQKARRARPVFTPTQQALRNLRALKDPDNNQVNILTRLSMEGGIAIYSDKVRKLRKQQGKPTGGELDWLEKSNIPPFWKGVVFRRGATQNVDKVIASLFEEGYFPQAAEQGDVTGEMLAEKIEDVLARYQALKDGQGDLADADEQYGAEMGNLERQRVEFERSTASGPVKVRPADLKPGDVMQVKGDDGKLHPVEVLRLESRPLEAGEDYDPQGNPGHRMGPDGPEVIESVTLKDGTTFGVQMVDGQEGLYVDEFKVKDAYDFHASLRDAVLTRKLTDDEALLHFMDHEGLGPDTPFAEIVRQLQSKLRIPMKRAQELLAAVFDTAPRGDGRAEIDPDNALGNARKRDAGPSMFGEDFDLLSGDSQNRGLFEQAMGATAAVEASTAGFALVAVTPEQLDAEMAKAARKAKLQARQEAPLVGTAGEYGTPDLLDVTAGPMALFSQPVAARGTLFTAPKRVLMRAEQDAASEPPPARPDLDDYLPPKAERKTSGKVATGMKHWHQALKQWKPQFAQWAERQGKLGAFLAPPVKSAFGPMYQRANVVTPKAGGGWRTTVFGRYEPDGITEMSGDWAAGAWVPIGHHEFESKAEAYEDAMSGMDGAEFTRRALFAAAKRVQDTGTLFGEDQMMFLGDRNTLGLGERKPPASSPPSDFTLESTTPAQLDAEARRKELREKLRARQDAPLIGTQGDIGQMDMLGGNDLFSAPAAKVSKAESGEQRAESGEPERVVAAALRDPRTGRVFTGVTHGDANPRDKKVLDLAAGGADPQAGIGFVTNTGRYVTSDEAERVWGIQGSESSAAYWEASKPQIVDGEGVDGWVEPMSEADWRAELDRRRAAEAEMAGRLRSREANARSPVERSAWAMVDTDTENSGAAAADMLQWQHDPALRAPGSRIDEMLTRLEGEWQKDAGAVAADRSIQAGRVSDPHDSRGGSEALVFARTFEQLTGKQIVWINTRPEAGIPFRAAVIRDRPNTIFVHVRAQANVLALIGHEWGHTLASQDPDLYRELQRQLAAFISRADGKQMRKELVDRYHRRVRSEEVTNNIIGDFFTEPAFWREVEAQDSGLLKRLLDSVRQWFDRLAALARSQWGMGARLQNIEAARRAVAQAFTEALKRGPYSELGPVDDAALTQVDQAAHEAATSPLNDLPQPTPAQREAGNYQKGHVRIAGHEISIENPAGSKRRPEWPALKDHYGYFKGTNAKDGDHVDVFVKPGTPEDYDGPVHVVRQNKVERNTPKNDGILAAKGVDWKHAESRLVQGLASLNSQQGTSLRLVSGESEKPETYTRAGSAIRPYTARADLGDLFAEEEKLIARAKAEGFFWDTAQVDKIKSGLGDSGGGTEHDVWFVNEQKDGRIVIRSTILDSYGFQGRSPAQYLKRLEDYNQAFPALQTRLIGVSRNARGNGVIWTAQPFVEALELKDDKRLQSLLEKKGFERIDKAGDKNIIYRHTATGAVIHDAHAGNVLVKGDELYPIDVIVTDLGTLADKSVRAPILTKTGVFDEYKVMLGYPTAEEAREAYLRNYEPGWPGLHKLSTHSPAEFQKIKETIFTVPADRVPGVREGDAALASGVKRAQNGDMADPDQAAQNNEPSPGGLSEAEFTQLMDDYREVREKDKQKTGFWMSGPYWHVTNYTYSADSSYVTYRNVLGVEHQFRISNHEKPPGHSTDRYFRLQFVGDNNAQFRSEARKWISAKVKAAADLNLATMQDVVRQWHVEQVSNAEYALERVRERAAAVTNRVAELEDWLARKKEAYAQGIRIGNGKPFTTENQREQALAGIAQTENDLTSEREASKSKIDSVNQEVVKAEQALQSALVAQQKSQSRAESGSDMPGRGPTNLATSKTGQSESSLFTSEVNPESSRAASGTLATAPKRRDNPAASPGGPQRAKADLSERGYALGGQDTYGSRRLLKFPANDQGYHNWDSTNHPGNTRFKKWRFKNGTVLWVEHSPSAVDAEKVENLLADNGLLVLKHKDWATNETLFDGEIFSSESSRAAGGTLSAAPKRRDNPAASPGAIPPAATAEDFARPDNALLRGMSNADWNRLDKGVKKWLDRILEPVVRQTVKAGDAAVEKLLDWVVGESLEGLEHAAGASIEDVQQRKAARAALKAQARRAWQKTVRQVMPDATVPADVLAKMREMRAAESLSQEKALDVSKRALEGKTKLLDIMAGTKAEEFKSPDVRRKMYLAMNAKINSGVTMDDLTPEQRAVALALKQAWWENGMRRVRNGTLKLETFQDMAEGLPQYYEDDVNLEKGFIPRAFKMGLKGLIAQRSTRFHIVDKTSKDKSGEFALVNWTDPSTKRTDWKYKSKAHMDAAYEQIIEDQILAAKDARTADYGKLAPDDIRTLRQYTWMTDADRAALAGVTREKLRQPASLTTEQKAVVDRMTEQLHSRFQKKVPLTYQQHEKAGLIQDPFYAIGRALLESGHDNATAEFFNYIAKQPDYVRDVAENGFTAMPDDPKMGRLAGKWVRDDVAAELEQMLDVPNMVMRFYDALLAGFKYGHTILNLGSHVRNILGNVSFATLAGSNPLNPGNAKAYAEANRLLRDGGPTFEALHKLGILGGDYLTNEVRRALRQLLPDPDTVERMIAAQDMSWLTGLKEQMARKFDKATGVLAAIPRGMENAWKWEDDIYKVAAFIKARQQGMSEEEAAAHVRKWFPFYDKGSSGTLKALGRFVFPFLSFKRESLRIMGHALRERPLAFLTMMAIPRLLTQLSFTILELQLIAGMAGLGDDDEEDLLKDMKGKAGGLLAPFTDASLFSIALPWRDANGGMAQWDLSAVIPWSDWLSTRIEYGAEKPWFQRVASQIVSGAPFASLLVETWANQDTFSGRRIWEDDMSGTEKAGRLAEHVYMKLAPPMIGPHVAAMKRAMEQQPSKLLPSRNPTQALMRILGIDIKPLAPDLYRKAEEYRKAKGAPVSPRGGQAFPQDAASRARARLYMELIQPEIDVQAADEAFAALEALGEPVRTLKDLSDLFKDRSPETIMPAKMRPGFVQSLPPESRRVYDSARTQQGEAFTRSKSVLQQRAEMRRRAAGMTN